MSKIIIVSGPPASGKSYFAKYLSQNLRLPIFGKDEIKEALYDTLGVENQEQNKKLSLAAIRILYHELEQMLQSGQNAVVESNFLPSIDGPKFRKLAEQHSVQFFEVHCSANKQILIQRYKDRMATNERHPGHHPDSSIPVEKYFEVNNNTPMQLGELVIVNTENYSSIDYAAILEKASKFLVI